MRKWTKNILFWRLLQGHIVEAVTDWNFLAKSFACQSMPKIEIIFLNTNIQVLTLQTWMWTCHLWSVCWDRNELRAFPWRCILTQTKQTNTQNHSASLTIKAAGLRQTKAFLREECQERQRFWRSRPWWRGLQKEKEGRDKGSSMLTAQTWINHSLWPRHDWDSC